VDAPRARTREPLRVGFPEPMDHALALRMITVAKTTGTPTLEAGERTWQFVPAEEWRGGTYELRVQSIIEDLAGNNIGKSFEVDVFENVQRTITNTVVSVPFVVE
jgi:hypothetical protein